MLTISGLSKSYAGRTLFRDAGLQVNRGDRIAIIGPNGAGKTTLFSLILKQEEPDSGSISLQRSATLGYLPQESAPAGAETVLELATAVSAEITQLQQQLKSGPPDDHSPEHLAFEQHYAEAGGLQIEARAKKILAGLGFRDRDFPRPAREMSGGWIMRAHLARLLVAEPDLLMLDEPTNHLDLESLLWFQSYLRTYPGAILMISHDREFLNALAQSIVEIRSGQLRRYTGNYDDFLVQREAQEEQQLAAYKNQQREIAHLMDFVNRFRAKNTKASQAQSKLKQIERMEKIDAPTADEKQISFRFPQPERSGLKVITLKNVRQAYGENVVYHDLTFETERGQRIVLVGPNGAGKSTLLKILAGVVPIQAGTRLLGHNVRLGYYAQHRTEMLNLEHTVLEEAMDLPRQVGEQFVRTLLGCFLFRGDDVFKRVSVLSGGEKSRLALVKILLDPPNLLLMDEPTTHLDMPSIDALLAALDQYEGTLIFISHDVYFIRALANQVLHVHAGQLTRYSGDYQYYLDKTSAASARVALTASLTRASAPEAPSESNVVKARDQKRQEAIQRQARSQERRRHQERIRHLEKEIAELEQRQTELTTELENPDTYQKSGRAAAINRELAGVVEALARRTADWETAALALLEFENQTATAQ